MNNAAQQAANGANIPVRGYIDLVSDDENEEDLADVLTRHVSPRLNPDLQNNNPSLQAPNVDGQHPGAAPNQAVQAQANADFVAAFLIEDGDDLDVNDPLLAQLMLEGFAREQNKVAARSAQPARQPPNYQTAQQILSQPLPMVDARIQCIDQIILVFPDICRDYVSELYASISQSSDLLVAHILDKVDRGMQYPNAKETQKKLKRKRELDEDKEATIKYGSADRVIPEGAAGFRPYM